MNEEIKILVVDDVAVNVILLSEMVKTCGYVPVAAYNAQQAMEEIEKEHPAVILLDVYMPGMDGFQLCEQLKKDVATSDIPVIFISSMDSKEDKVRGFEVGGVDFIEKPFEIREVSMRLNTHMNISKLRQQQEIYNANLNRMVQENLNQISKEQKNTVYALETLYSMRFPDNEKHLQNVKRNSRFFAQSLQFSAEFESSIDNLFIENIEYAAALHNIGRLVHNSPITGPDDKTHTEAGAVYLNKILAHNEQNDLIRIAIDIAENHHEKWDGSGYPKGLAGKDIPMAARIFSIVHGYDETVKSKEGFHLDVFMQQSGKAYDPDMMEVFEKIYRQLKV